MSDLERLRAFAQAIMDASDWPEGGDLDGFQIQEIAEIHGLLVATQQTKPCGAGCWCAEYNGEISEAQPAICFRKTPLLTGCAT